MTAASPTSSERMIEPELLITGEAVALEITPATVANRIASGLIDYAVYTLGAGLSVVVVMVLAISSGSEFRENLALTRAMLSLVILAWLVVIPLLVELLSGGRSLGRMVTGARVVRDDGGTVRLRHCLVRTLLAVVEIWGTWAVPALCASIVSKRGEAVRGHAGRHLRGSRASPLPRGATAADAPRAGPVGVGHGPARPAGNLSLTARTFLQRASSLVPSSRHQLGLELASQVQGYVLSPHLPPARTRTVPCRGSHRAAQP